MDLSNDEFACGDNHINGIKSFWSFAKRRLAKFNGQSRRTFHLHLRECEWRFNHRGQNLYRLLLADLRIDGVPVRLHELHRLSFGHEITVGATRLRFLPYDPETLIPE